MPEDFNIEEFFGNNPQLQQYRDNLTFVEHKDKMYCCTPDESVQCRLDGTKTLKNTQTTTLISQVEKIRKKGITARSRAERAKVLEQQLNESSPVPLVSWSDNPAERNTVFILSNTWLAPIRIGWKNKHDAQIDNIPFNASADEILSSLPLHLRKAWASTVVDTIAGEFSWLLMHHLPLELYPATNEL